MGPFASWVKMAFLDAPVSLTALLLRVIAYVLPILSYIQRNARCEGKLVTGRRNFDPDLWNSVKVLWVILSLTCPRYTCVCAVCFSVDLKISSNKPIAVSERSTYNGNDKMMLSQWNKKNFTHYRLKLMRKKVIFQACFTTLSFSMNINDHCFSTCKCSFKCVSFLTFRNWSSPLSRRWTPEESRHWRRIFLWKWTCPNKLSAR